MLTAACLFITLATLGACCFIAYKVGRVRTVRESDAFILARSEGMRIGRAEGLRERDELREQLAELTAAVHTAYEEARALNGSRPAVDEHLADRAMDIPVPSWLVPVEPCGQCGQVLPADHRTRGICTGAAR